MNRFSIVAPAIAAAVLHASVANASDKPIVLSGKYSALETATCQAAAGHPEIYVTELTTINYNATTGTATVTGTQSYFTPNGEVQGATTSPLNYTETFSIVGNQFTANGKTGTMEPGPVGLGSASQVASYLAWGTFMLGTQTCLGTTVGIHQ